MAVVQRHMTADELFRLPYDGLLHELVDGELRSMSPAGAEHGFVGYNIGGSLQPYVRARRLGAVYGADTGFVLRRDPDTVRAPDVAFITRERVRAAGRVTGYWPGAPDLAIEVISPNDLYTEVEEKVAEWLAHGTRLVITINPRRRTAMAYRPAAQPRMVPADGVLDGEDVVPGWSMPLADAFDDEEED